MARDYLDALATIDSLGEQLKTLEFDSRCALPEAKQEILRLEEQHEAMTRDRNAALGQLDELDAKVRGLSEQLEATREALSIADTAATLNADLHAQAQEQLEVLRIDLAVSRDQEIVAIAAVSDTKEQLESLRVALTMIKDRDPFELGYMQFVQHTAFAALGASNPAKERQ